jgi:hypothetical protein
MEVAGGENKFADTALTPGARGNPAWRWLPVFHHITSDSWHCARLICSVDIDRMWPAALRCNIDDATLQNLTIRLTNK